jgi:uncharacterized protein (TIGR02284 family)
MKEESMPTLDDIRDIIENLIETCRDGEKGFSQSAEHAKDPELRRRFLEESRTRADFASQLEREAVSQGAKIGQKGSVAGALHRGWIDLKGKVGMDDKSILESVEQGEDTARDAYQKALAADLPPSLKALIQKQYEHVQAKHDEMRRLRDSRAA